MLTEQDIICLPITEAEIKSVMQKALAQFDIAKRDNLRNRHLTIQFDCILRGYIGEYVMSKWLTENGILLTNTNFIPDGDAIDIDFLYKNKNIELKTSLVPDVDVSVQNSITKRDIKIIKREENIEHLQADIHLQIYFNQKRKAKDDWLAKQTINFSTITINQLYDALLCRAYINSIFFVGWMDKETLITSINKLTLNNRTWTFKNALRHFWVCKIKESKKPKELPSFLLSIV